MAEAVTIKSKTIAGKKVQAVEMTVAQVRQIFADRGDDLVGDLLFEDCRLADLRIATNLTEEDLSEMLPSEIEEVIKLAKEQNPHFFKLLARLSPARAPA